MEVAAILALVEKGITVANVLIEAGKNSAPAWEALQKLFKRTTAVTQDDLDKTEAVLDALIDEFNVEMPAE